MTRLGTPEHSPYPSSSFSSHPWFPANSNEDEIQFTLDILNPTPIFSSNRDFQSPFDAADLNRIEKTPFYTSPTRVHRVGLAVELYTQAISDGVSALEQRINHRPAKVGENKEDDSPITRTSSGHATESSKFADKEKVERKKKEEQNKHQKSDGSTELDGSDHVAGQANASRVEKVRGERKELSPEDTAIIIQVAFRAYLIRKSDVSQALQKLATEKTKIEEVRAMFNNVSYRGRVGRDAEERQRFSEKITVLLLTVYDIEGADMMVRAAKKSILDELEAMLYVVDPQLPRKSHEKDTDMPAAAIQEKHAAGVVQAFTRREVKIRGNRKELSPKDAALKIQVTFKAYLIRRSEILRALRELSIAKNKLKKIRALFYNLSFRRLARDGEERQRFTETIIVLILTVDGLKGADMMVRAAKKSIVDELEAILDVVDPQPPRKSHEKDTDMPAAAIQEKRAAGVAQAFTTREVKIRGNRKELSPKDAALKIQVTFKAYLIRRSKILRALRELSIAKNKLKKIRDLFYNLSYRRQLARDGEERQRFTETIIVLILTVDDLEGADMMVRAAKKSIVDELEAVLDLVDPQPPRKSHEKDSDMPAAAIQEKHAAGVVQAFTRREAKIRGNRKELSPKDAALKIQVSFKAYLIRRSEILRALRELSIANNKLKKIRALFYNLSYMRRLARAGEERQRFSETIIVLILTVDGLEGADVMVRSAKKSMVDELEAMLDVVDPQPPRKSPDKELSIAKNKLKKIRALFYNPSYRRQLARDGEERQRFTETISVLILTVDGVEGAAMMVRAVKKLMNDELEAMLDVVDPQPLRKSNEKEGNDMPDGVIQEEHAAGVAQAFTRIVEKIRVERKEFSPQDAALKIQVSFRAYLIRRSEILQALQGLSIAKNKTKKIRALFYNLSYRRRLAKDGEERQWFTETIIVLILTVDGLEGADMMVRAAKKSIVVELEAVLDLVDPQPPRKSHEKDSDMPAAAIQEKHAAGVAQAFTRREAKIRGNRKALSPKDAALKIQVSFKAYLIRRSEILRALRELSIAKNKLKKIRALFYNLSYMCRLARDGEERQRFSETIIVLILTVDGLEGTAMMVRAVKKSMNDELEAMLDVVDPQPLRKSNEKEGIDMPDGVIQEEHAAGVAQAFTRIVEKIRVERKEFSPQDAALKIQVSFRAYLIRRSEILQALRGLSIAKNKTKKIRALFYNLSYRRRLARDGEERQWFTETIIVLILTVDGLEGADMMVRAAKKSIVVELEAVLDLVDPQPPRKSHEDTDMPAAAIQKKHAAAVAQAFTRREAKIRGNRKELSPKDAVLKIQESFKAYLIRRSEILRALRELSIAKNKLKKIRALFYNLSYMRRLARDGEEHQRFSETIVEMILTVDGLEGADVMVRSAKKSMVDELEAMLDVVDPQPPRKSPDKEATDIPAAATQDEHAGGVAQAFTRREAKIRGNRKALSPKDAALKIQVSFKAYLIRRSEILRALRELSIAKNKLKKIRALFYNPSYRRQLARDGEERQRFTETIIVLILTVDGVEGAAMMIRVVKKSMGDELEAMLDVVDPQPLRKSNEKEGIDMPDGVILEEHAAGVTRGADMMFRSGKRSGH